MLVFERDAPTMGISERSSEGEVPFVYSETVIKTLLVLREFFQLSYCQTERLAQLMQVEVKIHDYTLLVKRATKMSVSTDVAKHTGLIDVIVDNTGLKIYADDIIPPRENAKIKQHDNSVKKSLVCDETIRPFVNVVVKNGRNLLSYSFARRSSYVPLQKCLRW